MGIKTCLMWSGVLILYALGHPFVLGVPVERRTPVISFRTSLKLIQG